MFRMTNNCSYYKSPVSNLNKYDLTKQLCETGDKDARILGMCEIRSFESNFELSFKIRFDSKNFY